LSLGHARARCRRQTRTLSDRGVFSDSVRYPSRSVWPGNRLARQPLGPATVIAGPLRGPNPCQRSNVPHLRRPSSRASLRQLPYINGSPAGAWAPAPWRRTDAVGTASYNGALQIPARRSGSVSGGQRCAQGLKGHVEDPQSGFELIRLRRSMDHAMQSPGESAVSGSF
jgi:hypothetical protein